MVPLVAYDRSLNRIGYGKGYFDRVLDGYTGFSLGVCFGFQFIPSISEDSHDVPVSAVITESDYIYI